MADIAGSIQAFAQTLEYMLDGKKYLVDYFQREFKWQRKHVEQLLVDLEAAFLSNLENDHSRESVAYYNSYYLGPLVISVKDRTRSIVDGQQRLTSITLLLIYLKNEQKKYSEQVDIDRLIYSTKYGKKSYNIEVPDRTDLLEKLYNNEEIEKDDYTDESVLNMIDRYEDIKLLFPEEIKEDRLLMFIDWLKEKVVFVEILAYTDENAYTIFETMNDRGLNLTPTEMLKGFVLSQVGDPNKLDELNDIWKDRIIGLHKFSNSEDLEFMRAWLRSQYAETIRRGAKGQGNEDFEKIGTKFHTWVKDNKKRLGLKEPASFYNFIKGDFRFFTEVYSKVILGIQGQNEVLYNLHDSAFWNIATSLRYPLLLAPISLSDDEDTIVEKLQTVSKFLDVYSVSRTVLGRPITQSAIKYSIYSLVKEIRGLNLIELKSLLRARAMQEMEDGRINVLNLKVLYTNPKFIHYLLARVSFYTDSIVSDEPEFYNYIVARKKNRFVVSSLIWEYNFNLYADKFDSEDSYNKTVNYLGNWLLIPNPLREAFDDLQDERKLRVVDNSTLLNRSLTSLSGRTETLGQFGFRDIAVRFNQDSIRERTELLDRLVNTIWNPDDI